MYVDQTHVSRFWLSVRALLAFVVMLLSLANNTANAGCTSSDVIKLNDLGLSPTVIDEICNLGGDRYKVRYNKNGAVLKSIGGNVTIYLGKSCDAQSPQFGRGSWGISGNRLHVNTGWKKFNFSASDIRIRGCRY